VDIRIGEATSKKAKPVLQFLYNKNGGTPHFYSFFE
jgi:hypothetical protein